MYLSSPFNAFHGAQEIIVFIGSFSPTQTHILPAGPVRIKISTYSESFLNIFVKKRRDFLHFLRDYNAHVAFPSLYYTGAICHEEEGDSEWKHEQNPITCKNSIEKK